MKKDIKIFAKTVESSAKEQIEHFSSLGSMNGCKIRIMPDVHAGKGCTIGTTIALKDKVIPNMVGVDIGCGMLVVRLWNIKEEKIDLNRIDKIINDFIPCGFNVHDNNNSLAHFSPDYYNLQFKCHSIIDTDFANRSLGTLGGGNHFIEIDIDDYGNMYLVIHSGSRNLGVRVCKYYQDIAIRKSKDNPERRYIIDKYKKEGREKEISGILSKIPKSNAEYAYIDGMDMFNYLHDMQSAVEYATLNRAFIADTILSEYAYSNHIDHLSMHSYFTSAHNYIDRDYILRKGACSANKYEKVIIPMNMRDGSLLCIGKGNPDWNYSAPHGAGRLMSRKKAHETLSEKEFENEMKSVYSTSVCESTIDESPMAYKPMEEIVSQIKDTVEIEKVIKPIYNFKAK